MLCVYYMAYRKCVFWRADDFFLTLFFKTPSLSNLYKSLFVIKYTQARHKIYKPAVLHAMMRKVVAFIPTFRMCIIFFFKFISIPHIPGFFLVQLVWKKILFSFCFKLKRLDGRRLRHITCVSPTCREILHSFFAEGTKSERIGEYSIFSPYQ